MNSAEFARLKAHDRVRLDGDHREWVVAYRDGEDVRIYVVGSGDPEKTLTPADAAKVTLSRRR